MVLGDGWFARTTLHANQKLCVYFAYANSNRFIPKGLFLLVGLISLSSTLFDLIYQLHRNVVFSFDCLALRSFLQSSLCSMLAGGFMGKYSCWRNCRDFLQYLPFRQLLWWIHVESVRKWWVGWSREWLYLSRSLGFILSERHYLSHWQFHFSVTDC